MTASVMSKFGNGVLGAGPPEVLQSTRCVCCSFTGSWEGVDRHVHEKHRDMSILRGNEYRIGGAQQLDTSSILLPPTSPTPTLYSCFIQELTSAGRAVCVYREGSHHDNSARPYAILRHSSELECADNRVYELEWNRWFTIPMEDMDKYGDVRNYEICLRVE